MDMPRNSIPKPRSTSPNPLLCFRFPASLIGIPRAIDGRATFSKLNATNCAVMVVPILAPIITPMACSSLMRPAFTKLTHITVVAPEDWIIAVTTRPAATLANRFTVNASRMRLILSPAAFCSPSPILNMPYRNKPTPPAAVSTISAFIRSPPPLDPCP